MVGTGPIIFVLETEEETAFGSSSNDLPQYAPASDTMIKCKVTRDRKSFFLISSYFTFFDFSLFSFFSLFKIFRKFFFEKNFERRLLEVLGYPIYKMVLDDGSPLEESKLILAARKRKKAKTSSYLISTSADDLRKDSPSYVAKVSSLLYILFFSREWW